MTGLAFSRDGTQLATSCEDQSMRVYAVADLAGKGNPVRARNFNLVPGGVAFGQTNNQLLAVLQSELLDPPRPSPISLWWWAAA